MSARPERLQQASHGRRNRAADADVNFVEDQRRHLADIGEHDLDRERQAGKLAAGSDARNGSERLLGVGGNLKLDGFHAEARAVADRGQRDLESTAGHRQLFHRRTHAMGKLRGRELALGAELCGKRAKG